MPISQEKFQITVPVAEEGGEPWADLPLVKRVTPSACDGGTLALRGRFGSAATDEVRLNIIPSLGIAEPVVEKQGMRLSLAGETDVSMDTNATSKEYGFKRRNMKNTDDQYSGEHQDLFYGDARGSDDTGEVYDGAVERNNYLDRE